MSRPKVTVLTNPLPWGRDWLGEGMRRAGRTLRDTAHPNRKYCNHPLYRGHFAVTRSLVEGLRKIGASFNYNPIYPWLVADTVIVLAGVRTLRQAIRYKQLGQIKKLFAGPNIVTFASDYGCLLAADEIDYVITPSDFVLNLYLEDIPALQGRIFAWPAGVDTDYWRPAPTVVRDCILIFDKRRAEDDPQRLQPYINYLQARGWQVEVLVRSDEHGYTPDEFRDLLQRTRVMLGFTVGSESQGLAWAEAWSTDVPTLILKNTSNVCRGRQFACSTAPYLHPKNGLFFTDFENFVQQFSYWLNYCSGFTPRIWVSENMSDEVCAAQLYHRVTDY